MSNLQEYLSKDDELVNEFYMQNDLKEQQDNMYEDDGDNS